MMVWLIIISYEHKTMSPKIMPFRPNKSVNKTTYFPAGVQVLWALTPKEVSLLGEKL